MYTLFNINIHVNLLTNRLKSVFIYASMIVIIVVINGFKQLKCMTNYKRRHLYLNDLIMVIFNGS